MKKLIYLISILTLLLIATACTPTPDPVPIPPLEPTPTATIAPEETPEPEEEPQALPALDLVGRWAHVEFTISETIDGEETPGTVYDWLNMWLEIREDNTFLWVAYGTIEGSLVQTGEHSFSATNLAAHSEGETWYPEEDQWLEYFPQTGLIRYTRFNPYGMFYMHDYFAPDVIADVRVQVATEELLNQFAAFHEFIEFDEPGYQRILITTDRVLRDFHFISISMEEFADGELALMAEEFLYTVAEVTPDMPFVVTWMDQGTIPHRGISFRDENGQMRGFTINLSGYDGSIILGDLW